MTWRYLEYERAVRIHDRLMFDEGQRPKAPLHPGKLQSALDRPRAEAFGASSTRSCREGSCSSQGIVIAHPFIDGNKRAGLGCMLAFLRMNGVTFVPLAEPLYDFVLQVTTGELREVEDMASCLRKLFAPHLV
ncbi:MAG TPA: Fic family protein [Tepidiformaceae bacterium]|nr:Fic family protein [Tepidiformaceae bacterium]